MAYGTLLTDAVQSSTANTPPQFNDGNGTQVGTLCRAWVNFNGTGTVSTNQTIRASFNVSSVFKNGTGDYTVNFTNAMPDANYSVQGTTNCLSAANVVMGIATSAYAGTALVYSVNAVRVFTVNDSSNILDMSYCQVAIFR